MGGRGHTQLRRHRRPVVRRGALLCAFATLLGALLLCTRAGGGAGATPGHGPAAYASPASYGAGVWQGTAADAQDAAQGAQGAAVGSRADAAGTRAAAAGTRTAAGASYAAHASYVCPGDLPGCSHRGHVAPGVLPVPPPVVVPPRAEPPPAAGAGPDGRIRPPRAPARAPDLHVLQVLRT
ncbi:hypothetical protein [Streptomyces antimicrobicus]|uniref:Uncharacterized protein n=1 Tax=Streptomyces antimicrobicus TaxID=2883108 RepID=A0ABS8B8X7_9ACTN|nr:hypothetical protein [Streptomyces antimicrobicus]MCB5181067.1 hypothetical protein [Streptomyces antimicrobicus]